ncbi:MAG: putative peptide zinc metalloprotease protein [bacterium]|jgi:putative peptide zinc metalloprotease protein
MTSDSDHDRDTPSGPSDKAPTSIVAPAPARRGAPPGVAPDQAPGGEPPTSEQAPSVVTPQTAPSPAATSANGAGSPPPRLAEGIELVGRFEDSGFKEAPYIARRSDGQMVQMPSMLYALAEVIDGQADETELAARFSERIERQVEPDMVASLLDEQLRPLGVVAERDGSSPAIEKVDPLLALKFRTKVIPDGVVRSITTIFKPLFWPPVVVVVVLGFIALDVWLFGVHGVSQSLRKVIYDPSLMFMLFGGVVLATAYHEIGHATGTRYGGAKPGVMGVGVYIVWPAFYTDITDAYRLGKAGRLRADMGGMYFNMVFALTVVALYALTGFEALLLLIVIQTFTIVQQSLPLLRLDGFYIISDLTGVPDMLTRIKPVLRRLIPGREPDARVTELKPWVRKVVTGYICTVVPLIALLFVIMLIHAPRAFATGYDSLAVHYGRLGPELSHGRTGKGILDVFEMLILVLPLAGITYTIGRVAKRTGAGAWSWSAAHPARRGGLALGTAAAVGLVAFLWWPHGEYRPIQPGERGTLVSAVGSLPDVTTGRAALTPKRARELHGAPFRHTTSVTRSEKQQTPGEQISTTPATTTTTPATTTTTPATTTATPATTTPEPATTTPDPATTTADPTTTTATP